MRLLIHTFHLALLADRRSHEHRHGRQGWCLLENYLSTTQPYAFELQSAAAPQLGKLEYIVALHLKRLALSCWMCLQVRTAQDCRP
jgi:hypothetical protein